MSLPRPTKIGSPVLSLGGGGSSGGDYLIERRILTNGDTAAVVAPPKTKRAVLRGIGGGGGGAGTNTANAPGGGGGAFAKTTLKISSGDILNVTAGIGGRGGTGTTNTSPISEQKGKDGTASQVIINGVTVLYADFGRGPSYASVSNYGTGLGGSSTICIGDVVASGGNGGAASVVGNPGVNGGSGGGNKPPYSGSTGAGGGGGAGGEKALGNLFDLLPSGSGGFGGVGDIYGPSGGVPGNTYGGGGGGGSYAGAGGAQVGNGGDGGMGGVVIEFYSDVYIPPLPINTDVVRSAFLLSYTPSMFITASGLTGDGGIKDLGQQQIGNLTGITRGNNCYTAYSPDGNWLVLLFQSDDPTGNRGSPILQIYKKDSSSVKFNYFGTVNDLTVFTYANVDITSTAGNTNTGTSLEPRVVNFSADSTEFTIPVNQSNLRAFFRLVNSAWTYVGAKSGFVGNFSGGASFKTMDYAESANSLVKTELSYGYANNNFYVNGTNRNTAFLTGAGFAVNTASVGGRIGVSPTGLYALAVLCKYSGSGSAAPVQALIKFNTDGTFTFTNSVQILPSGTLIYFRSPIVWLTDTRAVMLITTSNMSELLVFDVDGSSNLSLSSRTSIENYLTFSDMLRLNDSTILGVSTDLKVFPITIIGTTVTVKSMQNNFIPSSVTRSYAFITRP